jgi:hypothetical protein
MLKSDREPALFLFHGGTFFEPGDALVEMSNRLIERGHRSDEGTECDLHVMEIGAHHVEDIGDCLEAGVNLVVEMVDSLIEPIETLPDGEELLLG